MNWRTWAKLGRVSNLPTVWTNALAGWVLGAGGGAGAAAPIGGDFLILVLALSLFYVGGMYLNDAFDADIDAKERANRPIPAGAVSRGLVYGLGYAMLGVGIGLGFALGVEAVIAGTALAGAVVLYDWLHKRMAWSPLIMGACRLLSYVMAAFAAGGLGAGLALGAFGLFCHVVGLTYAARQEAYDRIGSAWPLAVLAVPVLVAAYFAGGSVAALVLLAAYVAWGARSLRFLFRREPGDVPKAVVGLIAGIALYDAVLVAGMGSVELAVLAVAGFAATLFLQRVAPGT